MENRFDRIGDVASLAPSKGDNTGFVSMCAVVDRKGENTDRRAAMLVRIYLAYFSGWKYIQKDIFEG